MTLRVRTIEAGPSALPTWGAGGAPWEVVENGDLVFLRCARIAADPVPGPAGERRLYLVFAPDGRDLRRVFLVEPGPPAPGEVAAAARRWALNVLTTRDAERLGRELGVQPAPGARELGRGGAVLAEGRYRLVAHAGHSELVWALVRAPAGPGALESPDVGARASHVVAVKHPELAMAGAPGWPRPRYPDALRARFGERPWIPVEDPALLDAEGAVILLLEPRPALVARELGLRLDGRAERRHTAALLRGLAPGRPGPGLRRVLERATARRERFPSAAALGRLLAGAGFPKRKRELVAHARRRRHQVRNADVLLAVLRTLPDREYASLADVTRTLGQVR